MTRRGWLAGATGWVTLQAGSTAGVQAAAPVLVFAAASLQTVLHAAAGAWRREAGLGVAFSFAGSAALARQIDQGAPADLFAPADRDWMDWAQARGAIRAETRRQLWGNTLVLIEPANRPPTALAIAQGFPLAAAIGDGRLATGSPASVPLGRYARQALVALGVWEAVAPRIAGADNARAALALVARGEAPFGIVYGTDARAEPRVRVVGTFPPDSHAPIVYPVAVTAASRHPQAESFLDFLGSPTATRIAKAEGFAILR